MFELRKAERRKAKLRIGVSGPSGSGKTYSALLIARGLTSDWAKIALIDTENSGSLYDHLGGYMHGVLEPPFTAERYIEAIVACEEAGMDVIIIDSMTHEWDGLGGYIEKSEKLGQAKYKGNSWAAKSETKPAHQRLIYAMIQSPCHIISTVRSKTETVMGDDKKVRKIGMKVIQDDSFEYEFTVFFEINRDNHLAQASKDRTELFTDKDPFLITEATGETLKEWSESGKEDTREQEKAAKRKRIADLLVSQGKTEEWYYSKIGKVPSLLAIQELDAILKQIQASIEKKLEKEVAEKAERERQVREEGRATPEEEAKIPEIPAKA